MFFFFYYSNGKRYNSFRGSGSLFNYNKCIIVICPQSTLEDFATLFALHTPKRHLKTPIFVSNICLNHQTKPCPYLQEALSVERQQMAPQNCTVSPPVCLIPQCSTDDLANSHVDIIPQWCTLLIQLILIIHLISATSLEKTPASLSKCDESEQQHCKDWAVFLWAMVSELEAVGVKSLTNTRYWEITRRPLFLSNSLPLLLESHSEHIALSLQEARMLQRCKHRRYTSFIYRKLLLSPVPHFNSTSSTGRSSGTSLSVSVS